MRVRTVQAPVGVAMAALGFVPGLVAVRTKLPRIVGRHLLLSAADPDVAREAVSLNAPGLIDVRA